MATKSSRSRAVEGRAIFVFGRVPGRLGDVGQEKFSKDGIFSRRGRSEDVEMFAFVVNGLERQEISATRGGGDVNFRRALINKCGRRFSLSIKSGKFNRSSSS